jgi:hypothetical protein
MELERPASVSLAPATAGPLVAFAERVSARAEPGESSFLLLENNEEALRWRLALIDSAVQSVDVQYYLWKRDAAGRMLARRLVAAADHGVRVRVLVDDFLIASQGHDSAGIAQHPNMEVRFFNPWRRRSSRPVARGMEWLWRRELNHRMHNKVLVADNLAAIAGGRNVANEYYGLNEDHNFKDLDVLAVGPVAPELSRTFDDFWNDEWAYPSESLARKLPEGDEVRALRDQLEWIPEEERQLLAAFPPVPPPSPLIPTPIPGAIAQEDLCIFDLTFCVDGLRVVRLGREAMSRLRLAPRLVAVLATHLAAACVGCINTGPANRAEEFLHLALQLDSEPEQVLMAGKVVWCTGTDNLWELPPECTGQWEGEGVVLMTDQELAFFRWTDRGYVVTERVPYAKLQKVRLDRFHTTGKFVVIHTDDQPLIFLFQWRGILHSNTAAEALYEALMERVKWRRTYPAPL